MNRADHCHAAVGVTGTSENITMRMKTKILSLIAGLALAGTAMTLIGQEEPSQPRHRGPGGPGGPRGPEAEGRRMPPPPLVAALDANSDGVIDAAEIDNAPAALRTLDKNGDGRLTREELRPRLEGRPFRGGQDRPPGPRPDRSNRDL
jgi:hypothetical protein